MVIRVIVMTWAVLLAVLSGPAQALILPPDPFDATDRYALLLPAADGTVTQVQAKLQVPVVDPAGSGELIAQVRYKLPAFATSDPGKPFAYAVSRAIPLQTLSSSGTQLVTFDFSDYPIPASAYHRSLVVLSLGVAAVEPQVLAEYPQERLLLRPAGAVIETALSSSQTAEAGSVVLGPVTILRESGAPQTETLGFSVADTNGVFFLRLTNGNAQGRARVTAAVVTFNGQSIFRPEEFNRGVMGLNRQISVQPGENVLAVTVRGEPGAQLTLEVVRQDGRICRALGPHTFVRATGKPVTEELTFALLPQLTGPFMLQVTNGDGTGASRVDAGVITLNGQEIVTGSDFNEQVAALARTVTLQALNTLRVELNGAPGDRLTLEITGFDNVPPHITITSPLPGTVVTAGPITVTGTVDDPATTLTVNGVVATVNPDGTFTAEGVPLQEGDTLITVIATDSCGNQGQGSLTVRLDTGPAVPPELRLCAGPLVEGPPDPPVIESCPAEFAIRSLGTVMGEVDATAVSVRVEGVLLPDGVWTTNQGPVLYGIREGTFFWAFLRIPEPDGPHTVTAVAANSRGHESTASVTFLRDTVPPVLTITAPPNPTVTNASTVTITGTVDDPQTDLWLLQPTIQQIPVTNGNFALTVTLPAQQGTTTYWIVAWDQVRNASSVQLRITRDTISPQINLYNPLPGSYLPSWTMTVNGVIIDQNIGPATVSVNGGAPSPLTVAPTQGTAAFSGVVPFNEGANTFSVTAVDKAGNSRTVTSSATVDTVFPTITLTAPADAAQLSGLVTVTAQAADVGTGLTGVTLLVDGQVRTTDFGAPYTFSLDTLTVPAGRHTLTVRAADRAGNTTQASVSVTVQPQLRLQITSPTPGSTVLYSPILVQGTIANNYGPSEIGITVNGYVAETQGGKFAVDGVALASGANTLTATVTDGAGVTGTATANVQFSPTASVFPPVRILVTSPSTLAPATATVSVETHIANPAVMYQVDFEGDGVVDLNNASLAFVSHTYSVPGLFVPRAVVTDSTGATWTASTVMNVMDRTTFGAKIEDQLNAMRTALLAGDLDAALTYFVAPVRDRYRETFVRLQLDLPQILSSIELFHFLDTTSELGEAEAIRSWDGVSYSFPITFLRAEDGLWKIGAF